MLCDIVTDELDREDVLEDMFDSTKMGRDLIKISRNGDNDEDILEITLKLCEYVEKRKSL